MPVLVLLRQEGVVERHRVVDGHAAHRVDHGLEPREVDRQPVLDLEPGDLGDDRGHEIACRVEALALAIGAREIAGREHLVDLPVLRIGRDALDPQVARDRDRGGRVGGRVDREHLDRVGEVGALVALAAVADHEDVHPTVAVQRAEERGRGKERARDRCVERRGADEEQDAADDDRHQEQQEHRADGPARGAPPPSRRARPPRSRWNPRVPPPIATLRDPARANELAVVRHGVVVERQSGRACHSEVIVRRKPLRSWAGVGQDRACPGKPLVSRR